MQNYKAMYIIQGILIIILLEKVKILKKYDCKQFIFFFSFHTQTYKTINVGGETFTRNYND